MTADAILSVLLLLSSIYCANCLTYNYGDGSFYVGDVDAEGRPVGVGKFHNTSGRLGDWLHSEKRHKESSSCLDFEVEFIFFPSFFCHLKEKKRESALLQKKKKIKKKFTFFPGKRRCYIILKMPHWKILRRLLKTSSMALKHLFFKIWENANRLRKKKRIV